MILSDLTNSNAIATPQALRQPGVRMLSGRSSWKLTQPVRPAGGIPTNNPNDPSFVWTYYDEVVAQAYNSGVGAWLRISVQGASNASWLGGVAQSYVDVNGKSFYIWWDTQYQAYLTALIQAFGKRYAANPTVKVFTANIVSDNVGDWTTPHVAPSSLSNKAGNWTLNSSFTCPAYNATVVVTPSPNQTVHNGWVVYIANFGWFQITSFHGPNTNPSTVTLMNLGISGNASSGTVPASSIMFVSDVANLQGPVYGYTTSRFVSAVTNILSVAHAAFPNQVLDQEVGRSGTLDPWPITLSQSPEQESIGGVTGSQPYTKAYPSNVDNSDTLLAALTWNDATSTVTSFTDTLNNAQWDPVGLIQGQNRSIALFLFANTLGGSCTVQATLSAIPGVVRIALFELPGSNIIVDAVAYSSGSATTSPQTGTITPPLSTDLAIAFLAGGNPITAGQSGWTFQTNSSFASQYFAPGSTAPLSAGFTQASSAYITAIITLSGLAGVTYQYNSATLVAQWAYATIAKGYFAIEKDTFTSQTDSVATALSKQDNSSYYLPAQTVAGSTNTSGTSGVIPAGAMFNVQFSWHAWDPTGLYTPQSTASNVGPYNANGGIPYNNPQPVYLQTIAICQQYLAAIVEAYELDILNLIIPPNWGIGFLGKHIALISPTSDIVNLGYNV